VCRYSTAVLSTSGNSSLVSGVLNRCTCVAGLSQSLHLQTHWEFIRQATCLRYRLYIENMSRRSQHNLFSYQPFAHLFENIYLNHQHLTPIAQIAYCIFPSTRIEFFSKSTIQTCQPLSRSKTELLLPTRLYLLAQILAPPMATPLYLLDLETHAAQNKACATKPERPSNI